MVEGENIEIGAKAAFEAGKRASTVSVRYKKLKGLLKCSGSERNFDLLKARQQFDQYDVSAATLRVVTEKVDNNNASILDQDLELIKTWICDA